ncbi:MAG: MoxR family ATPase [Chloroflexi bacterium]|nr:MAG: MoxR family ATPase [Chloroflexota bacterium]
MTATVEPSFARSRVEELQASAVAIEHELARVIVGYEDVLRGVLVALLAGGHALLEGAPGLGKTLLVRTLSEVLHLRYSRIQFTPDLMPSDIIGTDVLVDSDSGERRFVFKHGPIFGNLLLADEINRASPKTQSALLEAMQERTITVGTTDYALPEPFFVLATQNPIEMAGTYPLPEAQLDRFLFKLKLGSPSAEQLTEILNRTTSVDQPRVRRLAGPDALLEMRHVARQVFIAPHVMNYAVRLILATYPARDADAPQAVRQFVRYGASPRAGQALVIAAKVTAFLSGRFNVSYQDIRDVARASLRHRLILNIEAEVAGTDVDSIVEAVIHHVPEEHRQ